jgi:hypothetical protein
LHPNGERRHCYSGRRDDSRESGKDGRGSPERSRGQDCAKQGRKGRREKTGLSAFQDDGGACRIYEVRPFSCTQLYSLRKRDSGGPLIHRLATEISRETVKEIQRLDDTGYSGHISFILHLLDMPQCRQTYLSGGFNQALIAEFGNPTALSSTAS